MSVLRKRCLCLRAPEEEIDILDYSHSGLTFIPSDVFTHERTLEELLVNNNRIRDLPRELFYCQSLRKVNIAENEVVEIPPVIGSLNNLEYLDISKNAIVKLPDGVDACKKLRVFEASVNPLEGLSEGLCRLIQLSELYLNDCFLDALPSSFGRLSLLKILELRENSLKNLPSSMSAMTVLERLDIGMNQFSQMPEVISSLISLQELWFDNNSISILPQGLGNLPKLTFMDGSRNKIEWVAPEIEQCVNLNDLDLSHNVLQQLPESFGRFSCLLTLKLDTNCLTKLPFSIGGMASLVELDVSVNNLEELPIGIGLLRRLRTFRADDNFLVNVPIEIGSCGALTILSLRSNNLTYIPDEIGHITNLRVLNLSDNKLTFLPFSLMKLKELKALWLAEIQVKPLMHLQSDTDPRTGQKFLTSYLLPQESQKQFDSDEDTNSFHPSVWEDERRGRCLIQFDFQGAPPEQSQLYRTPTPYPKELKQRIQHLRNMATKKAQGEGDKSEVVAGRRTQRLSGASIGLGNAQSPSKTVSPLMAGRHVLLKADKEKFLKDKARMQHNDENGTGSNSATAVSENTAVCSRNQPMSADAAQYQASTRESNNNSSSSTCPRKASEPKQMIRSDSHGFNDNSSQVGIYGSSSHITGFGSSHQLTGYHISQEKRIGASEATVRSVKMSMGDDRSRKVSGVGDQHQAMQLQGKKASSSGSASAEMVNQSSSDQLHANVSLSAVDVSSSAAATASVSSSEAGIETMTFREFVNNMAAQGRRFPAGGVHRDKRYPPSVYVYQHRNHQSVNGRRHGYESDTGYRSDAGKHGRRGYESDVGYHGEVGYRSDTDSLRTASSKRIYRPTSEHYGKGQFAEGGKICHAKNFASDIQLNHEYGDRTEKGKSGFAPYSSHGFSSPGSQPQLEIPSGKLARDYQNSSCGSGGMPFSRGSSSGIPNGNSLHVFHDGRSKILSEKNGTHEAIQEEIETTAQHVRNSQERQKISQRRFQSQDMEERHGLVFGSNTTELSQDEPGSQEAQKKSRIRMKKNKNLIPIEL